MKMLRSFIGLAIVLGMLTVAFGDTPRVGRAANFNGVLVRVDGHDLVIRVKQAGAESKEITLPTDDDTLVRIDGDEARLDDLRAEMFVQVTSPMKNAPGPARLVKATSKSLSGVAIRVEGRTLVVKTSEKEVAVETDGGTQIYFAEPGTLKKPTGASAARLEDIKQGMRVRVLPDTGAARKIYVTVVKKGKAIANGNER
jgi:hypothetical protein